MYKIKEYPEDFTVKEIPKSDLKKEGDYTVCLLKKKNYTTIRAIEQIANVLNKKTKDIGFAGTKDKRAVTEQFISVKDAGKYDIEKVRLKEIELRFIGYMDEPISLGDLEGNEFVITIRNLKESEILNLEKKIKNKVIMPNLFGEQRFSENNVKIGKLLLKSDFKEALKLILDTNPDYRERMEESIKENPNDFVGALRLIPKKLLRLYVHAYQSCLWNRALEEYAKKGKENTQIPLLGFGIEMENKVIEKIITRIMEKEGITFRSFINRSIPDISLEGSSRDAFIEIKDLKISEKGKDFIEVGFSLQKGSYATVAVDFLLNK